MNPLICVRNWAGGGLQHLDLEEGVVGDLHSIPVLLVATVVALVGDRVRQGKALFHPRDLESLPRRGVHWMSPKERWPVLMSPLPLRASFSDGCKLARKIS